MKMNWGGGIAVTYITFMVIMIILAVVFMNQDVSLETKDYYSKGISYQQQIDKMNRTKDLPEQLSILQNGSTIDFSFPKIFKRQHIGGKIFFYRPADNKKDFVTNIEPDTAGTQFVDATILAKGLWKIKVDWLVNGTGYYNEHIIMVN